MFPREFILTLGPIGILRVGDLWSIDLCNRWGIYGLGLRWVRWRRVRP